MAEKHPCAQPCPRCLAHALYDAYLIGRMALALQGTRVVRFAAEVTADILKTHEQMESHRIGREVADDLCERLEKDS